jgi:6-phospho-beta-glucosidase
MESVPADYLRYYYFRDEAVTAAQAARRTRAEEILSDSERYWRHYREQAAAPEPFLDPTLSRSGVGELELAVDVIESIVADLGETWPVNIPNRGSLRGFDDGLVVELPATCSNEEIAPTVAAAELPPSVRGLLEMLAEYQQLTADAAWSGNRRDAVRALAANPLVLSLSLAERLYAELAAAHAPHLPERLL